MDAAEVHGRFSWKIRSTTRTDEDLGCRFSTQFVFWLSMFSGLFPEKEKGEKVTYVVHTYTYIILCWLNDEVVLSSAIVYLQVDYVH